MSSTAAPSTPEPEEPELSAAAAPVSNKRVAATGVIPKQMQSWIFLAVVFVGAVGLWFSSSSTKAAKPKPGAAAAAGLGLPFAVQSIIAFVVAGAGCYGAHVWRAKQSTQQMPSIDAGMPASFESWVDASGRLARVRYRGASWDALWRRSPYLAFSPP